MIHVDRSRVAIPEFLSSKRVESEKAKAREFFSRQGKGSARKQSRFRFNPTIWGEIFPEIEELFHKKCAYCESRLGATGGDIEQFRPKASVRLEDGSRLDPGYWWLAYEWTNLYLACAHCNRRKQEFFPLADESTRALTPNDDISREARLLLDPCEDHPEHHLLFQRDGQVVGRTPQGEKSIEIFGLNRRDLVTERAERRFTFEDDAFLSPSEELFAEVESSLLATSPYAQSARQAFIRAIIDENNSPYVSTRESTLKLALAMLRRILQPKDLLELWFCLDDEFEREKIQKRDELLKEIGERDLLTASALEPRDVKGIGPGSETREAPKSEQDEIISEQLDRGTDLISLERIEIRNFRAIRSLEVELNESSAAPISRPWLLQDQEGGALEKQTQGVETLPLLVLLGENATGKSSILEAIALALMGESGLEEFVEQIGLLWERMLSRGADAGHIELILNRIDTTETIRLEFDAGGARFTMGGDGVPFLVRGYGGTRLAPERKEHQVDSDEPQVGVFLVDNLFNPRAPLVDVDRFFSTLEGAYEDGSAEKAAAEGRATTFDLFARAVWDVLRGARPAETQLQEEEPNTQYLFVDQGDDSMRVKLDDHDFCFDELSAEYKSMIALVADILGGAPTEVQVEPRELTGIVMIDEIGAHLHPSWRQRVVRDLRETFPSMQFLITTHEPLCLQGVRKEDQIVLLRASEPRVKVFNESDPSPAGMRADQLLTSRYFGLHSTIDPDLDELFRAYYDLLAKDDLSEEEKKLRDELKAAIDHAGQSRLPLGSTRREQLLFEILDDHLQREQLEPANKPSQEVADRVKALWTGEGIKRGLIKSDDQGGS